MEDARNSLDSSFLSDYESARESEESLRREMVQMEIMEAGGEEEGRRESRWGKRWGAWTAGISLPAISLRGWMRGWQFQRLRGNDADTDGDGEGGGDGGGERRNWRERFRGCRFPDISMDWAKHENAFVPIARAAIIVLAAAMVYALFATGLLNYPNRLVNEFIIPERLKIFAAESVDYQQIDHWMQYLGSFDHMAGTQGDLVLAKYVEQKFIGFGLDTERTEFDVYLNTVGGKENHHGMAAWVESPEHGGPKLWEMTAGELKPGNWPKEVEFTPVYHGMSKSGTARGPLIYANYGRREDFDRLAEMGVDVKGAVVLVRHGGPRSNDGEKVLAAQQRGAVGVFIFTAPIQGDWMGPDNAVRRASVALRNWVVGDLTTPGYPSTPKNGHQPIEKSKGMVKIPSLPLSTSDARGLFKLLIGKGSKTDASWNANSADLGLWTGSLAASPIINLQNTISSDEKHPIWNVAATIPGRDPDETSLLIGTHRDAWCFGASNPNSGTAVLLEIARILGIMKDLGWRPLRTIQLFSFDGTEQNLLGSTEYVEKIRNIDALAYINLASAVTGTEFRAAASPALKAPLLSALPRILDPMQTSKTILDLFGSSHNLSQPLPGLGTNGDFTPFFHHLGIPSIDLTFAGPHPENSCHDTYKWIHDQDELFQYHTAMTKLLLYLILDLADTAIAPMSMHDYDVALQTWLEDLSSWFSPEAKEKVDLQPLRGAVKTATRYIKAFEDMTGEWMDRDENGFYIAPDAWSAGLRRARSRRMAGFDRGLVQLEQMEGSGDKSLGEKGGLPGREWFKHLVMGPQVSQSNQLRGEWALMLL